MVDAGFAAVVTTLRGDVAASVLPSLRVLFLTASVVPSFVVSLPFVPATGVVDLAVAFACVSSDFAHPRDSLHSGRIAGRHVRIAHLQKTGALRPVPYLCHYQHRVFAAGLRLYLGHADRTSHFAGAVDA